MRILVPIALYGMVVIAIVSSSRPRLLNVLAQPNNELKSTVSLAGRKVSIGPKAIGNLDTRRLISQTGVPMIVLGWAAPISPSVRLLRIEIFVDGQPAAVAHVGEERQDVAAAYARKDFLYSGWSAQVDLQKFNVGYHVINSRAQLSDGSTIDLGTGDLLAIE